ncbi:MAG TPA: type II secretion system protein [Acidimicrobiales bacterium]|nr:type II secretion system protein [Acidimicrobiales bacterium]
MEDGRAAAGAQAHSGQEAGFTLIEMVVAVVIIFGGLLALMSTATVGLVDAALARQRQTATGLANQVLEQIRGLPYETVAQGLEDTKLAQDPNIFLCEDGEYYFESCPSSDPAAEQIAHSAGIADVVPLVPNKGNVGPPTQANTYTWRSYVTKAKGVPTTGAYRATVMVSWNPTVRSGAATPVQAQTLIYKGTGAIDPTTGSGGSFFYGTSDLTAGSLKVTPNAGVSGGTGVTGLSSWDSISQDLSVLSTHIKSSSRTFSDSKVSLNGARKVVGGVSPPAGGATSEAGADDDPNTTTTESSTPTGVSQSAGSVDISGGGNRIGAGEVAASGGTTCPSSQPTPVWLSGMEHGVASSSGGGLLNQVVGSVTADSTVARNGTYSLKVAPSGATNNYALVSLGTPNQMVASFSIRFPSLPTASADLFQVVAGSAPNARLRYNASTGKLAVSWGGGDIDGGVTVAPGTWYHLDLRVTLTSPRLIEWRVNGAAQPQLSNSGSSTNVASVAFGLYSGATAQTWTAHYDDMVVSSTSSNYPIGDMRVLGLRPDGMGAHNIEANFLNDDGTAVNANSFTRLRDDPMTSTTDFIQQSGISGFGTAYINLNFADTSETCIKAVSSVVAYHSGGTVSNNGKTSIFDGSTERVVYSGNMAGTGLQYRSLLVTPASSSWTQAAVNGLTARIGYSTDTVPRPYWDALALEVAAAGSGGGGGGGGTPGNQSGSAKVSVPPSSPVSCYALQTVGACSYSDQGFASPAPTLRSMVNLGGSGAGDCDLYRHTPALIASSGWGRRDTSASATGNIVKDMVHYYGSHEMGGICAGTVSAPSGWPGYIIKYDPGTDYACVKAAAGIQAPYPRFCSVGTISYWNGSGVSTTSPRTDGSAIPVADLVTESNGWRLEIRPSLASAPSSVSDTNAVTADRNQAKANLGAPLTGRITYKLTNTGTGNVVVDLTVNVDLGSLAASAQYTP